MIVMVNWISGRHGERNDTIDDVVRADYSGSGERLVLKTWAGRIVGFRIDTIVRLTILEGDA